MRSHALIVVFCLSLMAQGCSNLMRSEGVEPTDLSTIKIGATRATVEAVLGAPIDSEVATDGRIDIYTYNFGKPGEPGDPLYGQGGIGLSCGGGQACAVYILGVVAVRLAAEPFLFLREMARRSDQVAELAITYGPDDRVVHIKRQLTKEKRAEQEKAEKERQEARLELTAKAEQGDAQAQYDLFAGARPGAEALYWLCRAANQSVANAQNWFGDLHGGPLGTPWRDAGLVKQDPVRAHMWYALAVTNGRAEAAISRDEIVANLTPAQITEAKRLAAEWKPTPGDCKRPAVKAKASSPGNP